MGLDANQKILADYNDVFADIMNGFLFHGRKVIQEKNLENSKDRSQYKTEGELHEQERDVSKYYNGKQLRIAFLGIEHENREENYMPLRVISYDGAAYRAQLLNSDDAKHTNEESTEIQNFKPYPVITLVLYFGTKHWTKAKTLYDALEIPEEIKSYVNDYRINLIEVAYLTPEQIELFHSDFRLIADFFVQKRISGEYIPPDVSIRHMDAFLKLLSIMVGDQRYEEILDELDNRSGKKEEIKMCEIYDQILNKGIEKGIEQERINSEKKIQEANKRAEAAEEELRRIKKQYALQ